MYLKVITPKINEEHQRAIHIINDCLKFAPPPLRYVVFRKVHPKLLSTTFHEPNLYIVLEYVTLF